MLIVEKFKQYPLVLWALALYLCCLGFNFKYDIPLALLAAVAFYTFGNGDNTTRIKQTVIEHWHVIIFLLLTLVVTFCSKDIKQSTQVQIQLIPALLMYAIIVRFVTDQQRFTFVMAAIIFGVLITELTFLAQAVYLYKTPDPLEKLWAIKSPLLIAPNDVLFFSVLVPIAVSLTLKDNVRMAKILGFLYLMTTLTVVIYMRSRQAVGIYFVSLCLMALFYRPVMGIAVAIISVLVVIFADWVTGRALSSKLVYLFPRRYVWEAAWQMFIDRPWVGEGPGTFKLLYHEFLERAGYTLAQIEDRRPMNWAHSLYLEQLAERGALGLVALILLIGRPTILMVASATTVLNFNQKTLLSMLLAFLLAGIAETSLLRLWVMTFIFLLIGLMGSNTSGSRVYGLKG